jgi:hypothetical protein
MSYPSVDKLQQTLAKKVFHYAKDSKKASGRALGTLVELITFYMLKDWGFESSTRIEKGLIEYRNEAISHNVEYTLHPIIESVELSIENKAPITARKILDILDKKSSFLNKEKNLSELYKPVASSLFSTAGTIKNACLIARNADSSLVAVVESINKKEVKIKVTQQIERPFAMVECKRVGIEEGNKKGPQTIEKAKQGAYVARMVSSLQKVRSRTGNLFGVLPLGNGDFRLDKYDKLLDEIISTDNYDIYRDFILTIGVVSNHGNWFTSDNPNKELVVLRDAYDWLLFLTDTGIATFIDELLLNPHKEYLPVRKAFLASYSGNGKIIKKYGKNQFTKAQINKDADLLLQKYFRNNREKIKKWLNIISPAGHDIELLRKQLTQLLDKSWKK